MITLIILCYIVIALIISFTVDKKDYRYGDPYLKKLLAGLIIPLAVVAVTLIMIGVIELIFWIIEAVVIVLAWIGTNMP